MEYTVITKDGEVCDGALRPLAPSIRRSCGHNHRSWAAASQCRLRLLDYRCDCGAKVCYRHSSRVCSADWYNAIIHMHEHGMMDYPQEAEARRALEEMREQIHAN